MIEAFSVADVRAAEEAAMAGLPDGELMARASRGLAAVVAARLEEREGMRVVGLVGAGNNGGDTLYALAHLAQQGFSAAAVHSASAHPGGLEAARAAGVALVPGDTEGWRSAVAEADAVVDGIVGIGGRPGLSDDAAAWVDEIPEEAWVVAVDLPSGADPSGEVPLRDAVFADETVTFGVAKPVHLLPATEPAVGRLTVVDIGLDLGSPVRPVVERLTFDDVGRLTNPSLLDYRKLTAADLPNLETIIVEVPAPAGPFGARGVGEPPIIPAPAAIANAIQNATGARLTELPMSPERIALALVNGKH